MKQPHQIKKWLQSQPWYPQYVDIVVKHWQENLAHRIPAALKGQLKERTVLLAWQAKWPRNDIWWKRHEEFIKWYHSNSPFCELELNTIFEFEGKKYIKVSWGGAIEIKNTDVIKFKGKYNIENFISIVKKDYICNEEDYDSNNLN